MSVTTQLIESPAMRAVIRERDEALAALTNGIAGGVSVVIPCYQQSHFLEDALKSVAAQTVLPLETLVVDDGSDATHAEAIRGLCERYGARYVRVTNRGLPNARNTGLMLARGEWTVALDSDDWLDPTYIEKTLAEQERTGADVVLTGIQEHGPERNKAYLAGFDRRWDEVTVHLLLTDFNRFYYCQLMRTRLLREVGGWSGAMAGIRGRAGGFEDWDLTIDLMKRGAKYAAVEEYLFNYRTHPGGSMLADAMAIREELVAEIRRHHA